MNEVVQERYIPIQLQYFIAGRRCCQQFSCSLRFSENVAITYWATKLGLHSRQVVADGETYAKVFKRRCLHYLTEAKVLLLEAQTITDLYVLLNQSGFVGSTSDLQMAVSFLKTGKSQPAPINHHFLLDSDISRKLLLQMKIDFEDLSSQKLDYLHMRLMDAITLNRVVLFDSKHFCDNLEPLPFLLLQNCQNRRINCQILCIEHFDSVAIYKSKLLAKSLGEAVGNTVGYQVHEKSHIGCTSFVTYTTAKYCLRVLMNQSVVERFQHITHLVVNDVHLHEPFTDILMYEIRSALNFHQQLHIVLLCDTPNKNRFLNYFGEGVVVTANGTENIDAPNTFSERIIYLEEFHKIIVYSQCELNKEINTELILNSKDPTEHTSRLDRCLEAYEEIGTDESLKPFLYLVSTELIPVNYRHSITGRTAVTIAAKLGNPKHLRLLLLMNANPFIEDESKVNAIFEASQNENSECIDVLRELWVPHQNSNYDNPEYFDYNLVVNLINLLVTNKNWKSGNILIIVPTYYQVLRLNYIIVRYQLVSLLPQNILIQTLHKNTDQAYLDMMTLTSHRVKVILATDIVETFPRLPDICYIIDSAREIKSVYNADHCCIDERYEWLSKDRLKNRTQLINCKDKSGYCFRMLPEFLYKQLNESAIPKVISAPLDKICLTVKLLSPHTSIAEYLNYLIATPPMINIHHHLQFLKKIDVLDNDENVTWLGCRLIDLPVTCQIGRMLVFGILLQCLDPISIIGSFMMSSDPLALPLIHEIDPLWQDHTVNIQAKTKRERLRLSERQYSDHFIFLRIYNEWEASLQNEVPPLYLSTEHQFMLNGIMEEIYYTRSHIVSSLRLASLVHSQGQLNIHLINSNSKSWPIIKAALTGGLYPNLCVVDNKANKLKSGCSKQIVLHPNSVLRELVEPLNISTQKCITPWVVYSKCNKLSSYNSIGYATLVVPLAVVMFAGHTNLHYKSSCSDETTSSGKITNVFIDEWISVVMASEVVDLVMKARQHFFRVYHNFLKHCADPEKWRRDSNFITQLPILLDSLTSIFDKEDYAAGFERINFIGARPKIISNPFLVTFNNVRCSEQKFFYEKNVLQIFSYEKYFFILFDFGYPIDDFYNGKNSNYLENAVAEFVKPLISPNRHVYIIFFEKNMLNSVAHVNVINDKLLLFEYFRNNIPIAEVVSKSLKNNMYIPTFNERPKCVLIDKNVGNLILNLFAFRNHWIN